jgi:protein TonB
MILLSPLQLSFIVHLFFAGLILFFLQIPSSENDVIQVPIEISEPQEVQNLAEINEKPKVVLKSVNEPLKSQAPSREVFGMNRNSYTDDSVADNEAVVAKKGNTITKESDKEILLDSDADSLPTPTEEYLVSEMPSVLKEVRPSYPIEAKEKRQEGAVVMDILIDDKGDVRQASIIDGPNIFLKVALEAIKKFKFRPARVEGKSVAVKIRYTLRFELEY